VQNGRNGYLCQVRDAADLADKLLTVAQLPPARLAALGAASRELATEKFDEQLVLRQYLAAVAEAGASK
jgi:glycosyltransferase involved in cell wall biosynthesis